MRFSLILLCAAAYGQTWPFPGPGRAPTGGAAACTPMSGYAHCRVISISAAQAGTVDSSNWPVSIVTTLGGSRVTDAQCDDVVFTSDSGGTTLIPWEIETCNSTTGAIVAWALKATLSHTVNGNLYVSYGNAAITTPQNTGGNAPSVIWGSNPTWHLPDGTTLGLLDSSTAAATLTNVGTSTATSGEIDGAVSLNGSTQWLNRTSTPISAAPVTMSAWFNTAAFGPNGTILALGASALANDWLRIIVNGGASTLYADQNNTAIDYHFVNGSTVLSTDTWYYAAVVFASGTMTLYLNGVSEGTSAYSDPTGLDSLAVGLTFKSSPIEPFNGKIDEPRMDAVARTASWLLSNYNSQKPSQTMVTVGSEI